MNHQDWNNIYLKNHSNLNSQKDIVQKKGDTSVNDQIRKIENDNAETFSLQKIPMELSKELMNIRVSKKLTQKDLANKLNIQQYIYVDLENGKALYSNETKKLLNKIERILNVKLEKRHINKV